MDSFDLHPPDSVGVLMILAYVAVWLLTLGLALTRQDLHPVTVLTWVLVIILVPFFGIFFYAFLAPSRQLPEWHGKRTDLSGTPWENNPGFIAKSDPHHP